MSFNYPNLILGIELEQFFHYFYYFFSMKTSSPITSGCVPFITSLENCMYDIAYVQGFYINVTLYEAFKLHITVALSIEKLHNFYPAAQTNCML